MSARLDVLEGLSEIDAATVVRCARVLLRRPLLRVDGPDGDLLPLVYRHRTTLTDMFAALLGYRLVVSRRYARLYKASPDPRGVRGEPGLSPRGYCYLALTVAVLTGVGRQVLLSRLVADLRAAAAEAGVEVADDVPDRRALVAALRQLVSIGVINETEGSVSGVLGGAEVAVTEALITIDTELLGHLLTGPLAEARDAAHLVELAQRPGPRGVEHAVRRRLVEEPVVHYADLPADQAEWLRRRGRRESALLERYFGLLTETRAEGVAVTDSEDYLTDLVFPGASTVARIALLALPPLLADESRQRPDGRVLVSDGRVQQVCRQLVEDYPAAWAKQATEDVDGLAVAVLDLLEALGLAVRDGGSDWLLSPAAHRWLPEADDRPGRESPPETEPEPEPGWSLFDTDDEGDSR